MHFTTDQCLKLRDLGYPRMAQPTVSGLLALANKLVAAKDSPFSESDTVLIGLEQAGVWVFEGGRVRPQTYPEKVVDGPLGESLYRLILLISELTTDENQFETIAGLDGFGLDLVA